MKDQVLQYFTKPLIGGLNNAYSPYYYPEIGLETLARARIYMHTMSMQLNSLNYPVIKLDTDAITILGSLPSALTSNTNEGWLKHESGPHQD